MRFMILGFRRVLYPRQQTRRKINQLEQYQIVAVHERVGIFLTE